MPPAPKWGRWTQDGDLLVYTPDPGAWDPNYEINIISLMKSLEEHVHQLELKNWIQDDDLRQLSAARTYLRAEYQKRELLDQPEDPILAARSKYAYLEKVEQDWQNMLAAGPQDDEGRFQKFLERHPCLLPIPGEGHHGVTGSVVISQPELPSEHPRRPDFMLLTKNSAEVYIALIEIETPAKPWFKKDGTPSTPLNQAIDQLHQWKTLLSDPMNRQNFLNLYRLRDLLIGKSLSFRYFLVHGRRSEASKSPSLSAKRQSMQGIDEVHMTYDRLKPNGYMHDLLTVKLDRSALDTKLRIINMPPTYQLTKETARVLCNLAGYRDAIANCDEISEERKAYLIDRLPIAEKLASGQYFWFSGG